LATTRTFVAAVVALVFVGALAAWLLRSGAATNGPANGSAMPSVRGLLGSVSASFFSPSLSSDGHRIALHSRVRRGV
jgi:hypothetical protein